MSKSTLSMQVPPPATPPRAAVLIGQKAGVLFVTLRDKIRAISAARAHQERRHA